MTKEAWQREKARGNTRGGCFQTATFFKIAFRMSVFTEQTPKALANRLCVRKYCLFLLIYLFFLYIYIFSLSVAVVACVFERHFRLR